MNPKEGRLINLSFQLPLLPQRHQTSKPFNDPELELLLGDSKWWRRRGAGQERKEVEKEKRKQKEMVDLQAGDEDKLYVLTAYSHLSALNHNTSHQAELFTLAS